MLTATAPSRLGDDADDPEAPPPTPPGAAPAINPPPVGSGGAAGDQAGGSELGLFPTPGRPRFHTWRDGVLCCCRHPGSCLLAIACAPLLALQLAAKHVSAADLAPPRGFTAGLGGAPRLEALCAALAHRWPQALRSWRGGRLRVAFIMVLGLASAAALACALSPGAFFGFGSGGASGGASGGGGGMVAVAAVASVLLAVTNLVGCGAHVVARQAIRRRHRIPLPLAAAAAAESGFSSAGLRAACAGLAVDLCGVAGPDKDDVVAAEVEAAAATVAAAGPAQRWRRLGLASDTLCVGCCGPCALAQEARWGQAHMQRITALGAALPKHCQHRCRHH